MLHDADTRLLHLQTLNRHDVMNAHSIVTDFDTGLSGGSICIRLDIVCKILQCSRVNDNDFVADFVAVEIVDGSIARVALARPLLCCRQRCDELCEPTAMFTSL